MMTVRVSVAYGILLWMAGLSASAQNWLQWGRDPQHTAAVNVNGQPAHRILADIVNDPFVEAEKVAYGGLLSVHYQVPIIHGDDVFMSFKTGQFTDPPHWDTQIWNERRLVWKKGELIEKWSFASDWKPVPAGSGAGGPTYEPVFHPVLVGDHLYIPGAGGSVLKVKKSDGRLVQRISPFGSVLNPGIFVAGVLSADHHGNVYYNAIQLVPGQAWTATGLVNSWLVKIRSNDTFQTATFASLTPGAPAAGDMCAGVFPTSALPWPPSPDAEPPLIPCGAQRPGINVAPAIAPDGTIYTVSVAHRTSWTGYLVAVNPDLTPKWAASLRDRLNTGCNVVLPPNGTPGGCRAGAHTGVDPAQNRPGAGRVLDNSSSSPTVTPDGSILYGAFTRFNWSQGHLMKFSPDGDFLAAYPFGWDITPGIDEHNGTYSILIKDNHYSGLGSYCGNATLCPRDRSAAHPDSPEGYFITRLDKDLVPEWSWQNTNTLECSRGDNGEITCAEDPDHQHGFEWCINAPAIDGNGDFFGNSEDGNLYVVRRDGTLKEKLLLKAGLGAAYTPLSIGPDGTLYAQNDGHLFVVGK